MERTRSDQIVLKALEEAISYSNMSRELSIGVLDTPSFWIGRKELTEAIGHLSEAIALLAQVHAERSSSPTI